MLIWRKSFRNQSKYFVEFANTSKTEGNQEVMRRWQRDKEWQIFQELAEFSNRNEGRVRGWRPEDDRSHENSTSNEMLIDTEFQSSPFGVFPFLCSPRFRFIVRRPLFSFHPPKSTLLLFTAMRISLQPVRNWFARTTRS